MKIAADCRMLGKSGIGTYIGGILPFLVMDNQCLLIGRLEDLKNYSRNSSIEVILCDIPVFSLQEFFAFPKNILDKINSCDVYYSPYCNIPNGIHIPVYLTIHDMVFFDVPGLASPIGTLLRKWYYREAIKRSDAVFTVSEFSKNRIVKKLHYKKKIIVTYNAVPQWFFPDPESTDSKNYKKDYILFVGNIKKHKGLHTLLSAFLDAKKRGLPAQLIIVGNADNFRTGDSSIRKKIENISDDVVHFTGHLTDSALKKLYIQAKLLVQPSEYEGFGLPPLEALSLGTHVLISDIPVFREVYKDMPVTFFKTDDTEDLAVKMIQAYKKADEPFTIPMIYSFEKTAGIILNEINNRGTCKSQTSFASATLM